MIKSILFFIGLSSPHLLGQVVFEHLKDRVSISINGKAFSSLYFGVEAHKPFLYPLTTSSGLKVSRGFPLETVAGDPTDHPHQKGLWTGSELVSGMDFWENDATYKRPRMGKIVFQDLTKINGGKQEGTLAYTAEWLSPEGLAVVAESHTIRFLSEPADQRIFDVDFTLTARETMLFEDHQDAVIGVRLGPAFDEKNGGMPINAEGLKGELEVRGKPSRWLDWQTKLDGKPVGLAILDHPANPSSPARWHLRSFGFMAANPFARKAFDEKAKSAAIELKKGESIRLRYRVIIHNSPVDMKKAYAEYSETKMSAAGEND